MHQDRLNQYIREAIEAYRIPQLSCANGDYIKALGFCLEMALIEEPELAASQALAYIWENFPKSPSAFGKPAGKYWDADSSGRPPEKPRLADEMAAGLERALAARQEAEIESE